MAGLSKRFSEMGYKTPKYMLELAGKSLFYHSVISFKEYFDNQKFVFVFRDIPGMNARQYITGELQAMGISSYELVQLARETKGQAETVKLALESSIDKGGDTDITIFNIDTFRPGFSFPKFKNSVDGYLEVFRGSGDNWSFVKSAEGTNQVIETAEKNPISNLCSTGLYYFKSAKEFLWAYEAYTSSGRSVKNEIYVAPLYNELISHGRDIRYDLIDRDDVIFCGVPQEYEDLKVKAQKNEF
ncbi:glycosyltransferase family 2 protein [Bdellovibrio sp. HCB274]|uniref:glycosyltransferase family 2 protein n=1 Tax=Bdellovibrio sp. HCB274 TaxID=3394361 RepID=UPI0039B3C263